MALPPVPRSPFPVPFLFQLLFFGILLPVAAWRSRLRLVRMPLPPKKPYFVSVIVQQVVFAGISLAVARSLRLNLFPPYRPTVAHLIVGTALIAAIVPLMWPLWREHVVKRERIAYLVTPVDRTDHVLWALISLVAGIGEEISYRGVFYAGVLRLTSEPVSAAVISSLAFGAGHLTQGWVSAGIIMAFALGFHGLAAWTGALYLGMGVHALYDLIAGFAHGRMGAGDWWLGAGEEGPSAPAPNP